MKDLYFSQKKKSYRLKSDIEAEGDTQIEPWRKDLRQWLSRRGELDIGRYFKYLIWKLFHYCCCCCRERCIRKCKFDDIEKKNAMIEAAMEKLQKEIDVKEIIKYMRVSHLIQKIALSKR